MCAQAAPEEDRPVVLTPPRSPWRVRSVKPLDGFRLWVEFQDGTTGTVEMEAFVHAPDAGVFAVLADPAIFSQVAVEFGAVTWPGEIDLAPDAMHQAIRNDGTWVL